MKITMTDRTRQIQFVNGKSEIDYFSTTMAMRHDINEMNEYRKISDREKIILDLGQFTDDGRKKMFDETYEKWAEYSEKEYDEAIEKNWE